MAYHVKAYHGLPVGLLVTRTGVPDNTAGRAGQDGTQATELVVADQAAVRLHEFDPGLVTGGRGLEALEEAVDVVSRLRGQVGVGCCGVCAVDKLDDGQEGVREGDTLEADGRGQFSYALFVLCGSRSDQARDMIF